MHGEVQKNRRVDMGVRGDFFVRRIPDAKTVMRYVAELAEARANDAARLMLAGDMDKEELDGLDLRLVTELKRGANGGVEIRLLDRLKVLQFLAELTGAGDKTGSGAENFFRALERSAMPGGERSE